MGCAQDNPASGSSSSPKKSNGNGWFRVSHLIIDKYRLGPYGLAVYVTLAHHVNNQNGNRVWPCTRRIAKESGVGRRRVFRELEKLRELGLISIQREHRKVNIYTLLPVETVYQSGSPAEPQDSKSGSTGDTQAASPAEPKPLPQQNTEQDLTEQDSTEQNKSKEREKQLLRASKDGEAASSKSKEQKQVQKAGPDLRQTLLEVDLGLDLWDRMKWASLLAHPKWRLQDPGRRRKDNMGPTKSMMDEMYAQERIEWFGKKVYWGHVVDFLLSNESGRPGHWYPFQYFMHEYMDKVISALPRENRLADLMKKSQEVYEAWPGAGPGLPREDVKSIV